MIVFIGEAALIDHLGITHVSLCEAVGHHDEPVVGHVGLVEHRVMPDGGGEAAGAALPHPLVLLLLEVRVDGGAAAVADAEHGEDVDLLQEGDLGGGGDELQGEAPHAHREPHSHWGITATANPLKL